MKLGIDTGGTFTDFILISEEGIVTYKVSSTPDDPGRAILSGLLHLFPHPFKQDCFELPAHLEIVHGTTVATNAFLQRKGAKTLLVTTKGFEDVLTIGRQNRTSLYDLDISRPLEIIPRSQCVGVKERVLYDGTIQTPLGKTVGARLRRICREMSIESVAICLLHSYANPVHEQHLAKELQSLGIPISISSEVLPEFREYERFTTTLINAYLAPVISSYIDKLTVSLNSHPLSIQQSNGGVLPASTIGQRAVHTVLSGPAGGVHGAYDLACRMDLKKIITFDMGGTSTDVSLCENSPSLTRDYQIDTYPIRVQVMDIHTVGAGGGSIASIDQGGLLHVGPESAGARPGPVCYGVGDRLTVTDANLFLGRLPADRFLGGTMQLYPEKVKKQFTILGKKLGMHPSATALGIIRLVNIGMAKAIRAVSLERGYDPKEFALFSFGGASGLHCCELASQLGIEEVVVPARAGILSAQGMAMAQTSLGAGRALFLRGDEITNNILDKAFSSLIAGKKKEMEGFSSISEIYIEKFVDLRYQGQSFEISVPYNKNFLSRFHEMHEHHFGYSLPDAPLEIVSIRCTITVKQQRSSLPKLRKPTNDVPIADGKTRVIFESGISTIDIFLRRNLNFGQSLTGPLLIVDDYTTILLPPQFTLTVDPFLNLIIRRI